jgi:hypothetical protein
VQSGDLGGGRGAADHEAMTRVLLELYNVYLHKPVDGVRMNTEYWSRVWVVPQFFRDNPRYLSNRELAKLPENPDRLNDVDNTRRGLARRLAEEEAIRRLDAALRDGQRIDLMDSEGLVYAMLAGGLESAGGRRWHVEPAEPGGTVEIDRYDPQRGAARDGVRMSAAGAIVRGDSVRDGLERRVGLSLTLRDVRTRAAGGLAAGERPELTFNGLAPREDQLEELLELSSREVIAESRRRIEEGVYDPQLARATESFHTRLERLDREVVAKLNERWASAAACLVMVLAGAVTAMRLGASLPLTVYLWSFFPALVAVLTISTGQHLTTRMGLWGVWVLWAGVGVLGLYTLVAFLLVRKH